MKTLQKLFSITLIGCLLSVSYSCNEKNIDLEPLAITESAFLKEEIDFDRSVLAIYAKLTDIYYFNGNNPIVGMFQLPGDDITTIGTVPSEVFNTLQPEGGGDIPTYYAQAYQLINRANTTLQKIAEENGVYKTPNLKNHHKGEALFLRGMMFYNLSNFFGTSPLITERITTTDGINPPPAAEGAMLDQAIKDFTEAATLLPTSWNTNNRGRATANAANGFLGKCLVFRASIKKQDADYTAALTALNKVTASLVRDFGSNFDAADENNAESLFEFQATQLGFDNVWLGNDFDNAIGSTSAYWGYYENHWSLFGKAPFIGSRKLLAAFDPKDPRLPLTMNPDGRSITKYVLRDRKSQSGPGSLNNPRILRFADIVLLKAEATLLSGGSTAASVEFINQVRTRARTMVAVGTIPANYSVTESDRNRIMNWIMNERFIELAGEESRWFDLRRWHFAGRINLASFDFSSERNDLAITIPYPIPLSELDYNPSMKQNSGY